MWRILGIEPTRNVKEIRSAYARLVKKYNPEEYPEEFKKLHDAYKDALKYAKSEDIYISFPLPKAEYDGESNNTETLSENERCDFENINTEKIVTPEEPDEDEKRRRTIHELKKIISDEKIGDMGKALMDYFNGNDFEYFVYDRIFRKEAGNAVFGMTFSEEAACIISSAFGLGTEPKHIDGTDRWTVTISEGAFKAPPMPPGFNPDQKYFSALPKRVQITIIISLILMTGLIFIVGYVIETAHLNGG